MFCWCGKWINEEREGKREKRFLHHETESSLESRREEIAQIPLGRNQSSLCGSAASPPPAHALSTPVSRVTLSPRVSAPAAHGSTSNAGNPAVLAAAASPPLPNLQAAGFPACHLRWAPVKVKVVVSKRWRQCSKWLYFFPDQVVG